MKNIFCALFFCLLSYCYGQTSINNNTYQAPPKLVVGIVIDQMRYDYIYKYWNKYGDKGFKRLVNEGFFCKNTNYNYVPTYTGPGHASIYTGATPNTHGIVANDWYDRKSGKEMYCAYDGKETAVGGKSNAGQLSPRNMMVTSVCDELRISNNKKSKVIGIALKDRGAILPAGHIANAAYWFDSKTGNWITSTYYMKELPKWVNDFNSKELVKTYLSNSWTTLLPIEQYTESMPDDNSYETPFVKGNKPIFPYNLPLIMATEGLGLIRQTPFGNSFTKDFALETIKSENMGRGEHADFLAVSFSSTDYIGHQFGPQSVEVEDCYLRLDKDIAEILDFIDQWVGKNNCLVFLTADHGAVDVPSYLIDNNIPAGYIDDKFLADSLKKNLEKTYGDKLVLSYSNQQVYIDKDAVKKKNINEQELYNHIKKYFTGFNGIANCYAIEDIMNIAGGVEEKIKNGYYASRSGDIIVSYNPGWVEYQKTGTTHGSPYSYDSHVPLLWYGWNIKPGSSVEQVNINDIAPTLSIILNIPYPNGCTGKPISYLFK